MSDLTKEQEEAVIKIRGYAIGVLKRMNVRPSCWDDIASEVTVKLIGEMKRNYDPEKGSITTWLYPKIRQRIIDHIRSESGDRRRGRPVKKPHKRAKRQEMGDFDGFAKLQPHDEPRALFGGYTAQEVQDALDTANIKEDDREAVRLWCEGHTQEELGRMFDKTKAAMSHRIKRALQEVGKTLVQKYGEPA